MAVITAQLYSTESEFRFWAGSNPAGDLLDCYDSENLLICSMIETGLNAFSSVICFTKQFIIRGIITTIIARYYAFREVDLLMEMGILASKILARILSLILCGTAILKNIYFCRTLSSMAASVHSLNYNINKIFFSPTETFVRNC